MNKREAVETAWSESPHGEPFRIVVSVPHGAVLPDFLTGLVLLAVGPGLQHPMTLAMDDAGLRAVLTFGDGVKRGSPFDVRIPWGALVRVVTPEWAITWAVAKVEPPRPALRVVK